eukprot:9311899-Heterocapsa_arctica.AAC.1
METKATSLPLNLMVVAVHWLPRLCRSMAPDFAAKPRLVKIHVPPELPPRPVRLAGHMKVRQPAVWIFALATFSLLPSKWCSTPQ